MNFEVIISSLVVLFNLIPLTKNNLENEKEREILIKTILSFLEPEKYNVNFSEQKIIVKMQEKALECLIQLVIYYANLLKFYDKNSSD